MTTTGSTHQRKVQAERGHGGYNQSGHRSKVAAALERRHATTLLPG